MLAYSYYQPGIPPAGDANAVDGGSILLIIKKLVRAFPNTWTMPLVTISSLNPINL